jgi:hypothetical protein
MNDDLWLGTDMRAPDTNLSTTHRVNVTIEQADTFAHEDCSRVVARHKNAPSVCYHARIGAITVNAGSTSHSRTHPYQERDSSLLEKSKH